MADRPDPIATSVWGRAAPRAKDRGNAGLTREQIVQAAVDLLDAEGADGLSMRKLATRLGSGTTSAYWHVGNKDQLLDLALDAVLGEVPLPEDHPDDWRAATAVYARGIHDVWLRHPWIVTVIGERPNVGPNSTHLSDRMLGMLTSIGFTMRDSAFAASALTAYAMGDAMAEAAWRRTQEKSERSADEITAVFTTYYEQHADAHPNFARWWKESQPIDIDSLRRETFEFGLRMQLDGLELRLHLDGLAAGLDQQAR